MHIFIWFTVNKVKLEDGILVKDDTLPFLYQIELFIESVHLYVKDGLRLELVLFLTVIGALGPLPELNFLVQKCGTFSQIFAHQSSVVSIRHHLSVKSFDLINQILSLEMIFQSEIVCILWLGHYHDLSVDLY